MKTFIRKNNWLGTKHGWGNGYVIIPKGHKLYGVNYEEIDVNVHGGLTFSEFANDLDWSEMPEYSKDGWVVGFDTAHLYDNLYNWPEEKVIKETKT